MKTQTRYELIKNWITENKEKCFYLASCVLIFIVGFGTGRVEQGLRAPNKIQANYTTKTNVNKTADKPANTNKTIETNSNQTTGSINSGSCYIKGTSSKIYHLPGGAFYERVTSPAACFNTESEAIAAGYRKSSR
jgi:hypothetical protein